jgi:hypothetical protein
LPIAYPQSQTLTNQTSVGMTLMVNGKPSQYNWMVAGAAGANYDFQTSTNLINWTTLFVVPNDGSINSYLNENPSSAQRFYRIVPQ